MTASAATAARVPDGLMQHDVPLALDHVLHRLRTVAARGTVVTAGPDGARSRATYADVAARCERLAGALAALGVVPGDRVATLQWNTQAHLEAYLAILCMGAVLHTLNLRLFADQLSWIINHAEDRVILVDGSLTPLLARSAGELGKVEHVVVIGEPAAALDGLRATVHDYETLLAAAAERFAWPALEERQAAALCYTSGTTGDPKGVLYSHRSTILHSLCVLTTDAIGIGGRDRVLPVVPMFHANAWGIPYAAALCGAGLVLPGPDLSPAAVVRLIEEERVTMAAGVPTIWTGLLHHVAGTDADLSSLRLVVAGGAAVPESLIRAYQDRLGLRLLQAWGMTETSPLASAAARCTRGTPTRRGRSASPPGASARSSSCGSWTGTARRPRGTARPRARWRSAVRGSPPPTTASAPTRSASTAAGCARATSPRSTPTASCGSRTARRT